MAESFPSPKESSKSLCMCYIDRLKNAVTTTQKVFVCVVDDSLSCNAVFNICKCMVSGQK